MYEECSSPLIQACLACNTEKVHSVLESGFNPNTERDGRGRTAMHIFAIRGKLEILESLRRYGVDFTLPDNLGKNSMHMCNSVDVLHFLARNGVSASSRYVTKTNHFNCGCLVDCF